MLEPVPELRITPVNDLATNRAGTMVLYWMTAQRRTTWNFAFQRAIEWGVQFRRPVVVLEALRCDYRWNSVRLHRFFVDGMADNAGRLHGTGVLYYPYLEPSPGVGKGLLAALARHACVVVTDDYPCTFLPRMTAAAARQLDVRLEAVDSNGLLPLRAADVVFTTAYAFRRFLQRALPQHLERLPSPDPLAHAKLPAAWDPPVEVLRRWPAAREQDLHAPAGLLSRLAIAKGVPACASRGGALAGHKASQLFLKKRLTDYAEHRNEPEAEASSGLSPYLHFGHVSVHQVFVELAEHELWSPRAIAPRVTGKREGWWGMSRSGEAFLDELVTWRELGFNMTSLRPDYDRYESLPDWARRTLDAHARDAREAVYTLEQFESAATHDALWNAAQRELLREGRIHNYLRMLWGKKILEWTRSPREALDVMIELNNKYALDGRDPNSYSGIFWVLGRYDRPWGPERPVFGTVRYMSSESTARKYGLKSYLARHAE
ncbi:MAG TPA: deoxyribodipyrimidine photolyase [Phycisphaerae bacterium]|nr:deoxyribodipyrimidine photolyase [Phycisphaerae bacterium]